MYDFLVVFCGKLKEKLPINTPPKVYAFLLHLYCQLFFKKKTTTRPTTLSIGKWNRKQRNRILCTSFSTIFRFPNVLSIHKKTNCKICICNISALCLIISKMKLFFLFTFNFYLYFFDLCIANLCFVWWCRFMALICFMQISIGSFLFFSANIYFSTRFLLRIGKKRNELQCHRVSVCISNIIYICFQNSSFVHMFTWFCPTVKAWK